MLGSLLRDLSMPTAGLVDKPQDARFYDWHLKDPKDKPFVTFKFHYRSWESLINLQLIPTDHPRRLLLPSPSILSLNGQSELQQHLQEQQMVEEQNYLVTADDLQSHRYLFSDVLRPNHHTNV